MQRPSGECGHSTGAEGKQVGWPVLGELGGGGQEQWAEVAGPPKPS